MMKETKLVPYSIYLPVEYYNKIKDLAKERKASSTVRDAIMMIVDGKNTYQSGYNQGLRDAVKAVKKMDIVNVLSIKGKRLDVLIADHFKGMEK